jgi:ribulose 1,5-bisphosphate synthetase/thiazole synthase
MQNRSFLSLFEQTYDVVVFGGGYAGFAAAWRLIESGKRVLLVDRQAALLWESGWAFAPRAGDSAQPLWRAWRAELEKRNAAKGDHTDGAIAEVLASEQLKVNGWNALYYATPMAVEHGNAGVNAVIVGSKSGLQRIVAAQWIDATETGELLRLLDPNWRQRAPETQTIHLYFRHAGWADDTTLEIPCPSLEGARLTWAPTLWPNERVLSVTLPGSQTRVRATWIPALQALQAAAPKQIEAAVLSHGSVLALNTYAKGSTAPNAHGNVAIAVPSEAGRTIESLAQRFDLGIAAAQQLAQCPQIKADASSLVAPLPPLRNLPVEQAEIAVAGAGTGGGLAAIAAARTGRKTLAFDPLPYAGGIGAGGGIHWYYYGVKGGLQDELDERTRQIMPLFGKSSQIKGFHPDAKKAAIEAMFHECGAKLLTGATVIDVIRDGARVTHAILSTPQGLVKIEAAAWIDATGDGDLAARAGAGFTFGRAGDGLVHAYSQSSGRCGVKNDLAILNLVNFDAGYVDPTDVEDMTRARLHGIRHYVQEQYDTVERPTYVAPALGLRQARHIVTEYTLTLADLVERRKFDDAVGLTGCHYDNHAIDYEFESDESLFYVWVCRQWSARTACEIPYGMIVPKQLDNVWMACRAAGVSQDAHHSFRMQRDIQRIGEVAGLAAALSVELRASARTLPIAPLRQKLALTGAVTLKEYAEDEFGPRTATEVFAAMPADATLQTCIAELQKPDAGLALWRLYRAESQVHAQLKAILRSSDTNVSWNAAAVLAMWGEGAAEPRLIQAIGAREYGFESAPEEQRPERNNRAAPRWLIAAALLRKCGTSACLVTLDELAADPGLVFNARTAIALTCEQIAKRAALSESEQHAAACVLEKLLATDPLNAVGNPQRSVVAGQTKPLAMHQAQSRRPVIEDYHWQLHFAVARARAALDLSLHAEAQAYLNDERAIVRRAFKAVCEIVSATAH